MLPPAFFSNRVLVRIHTPATYTCLTYEFVPSHRSKPTWVAHPSQPGNETRPTHPYGMLGQHCMSFPQHEAEAQLQHQQLARRQQAARLHAAKQAAAANWRNCLSNSGHLPDNGDQGAPLARGGEGVEGGQKVSEEHKQPPAAIGQGGGLPADVQQRAEKDR